MLGMFDIKLGTFVALGVRGSGMIENCSFNLGEFYVKMGKTNRNLRREIVRALFLLITYIVILIFQIILFVISIRKKTKKLWRILFSAELVPLLISIGLMIYYNDLPGYGFMPGLTYLGETLFSLGAVVLYCINFLISICSYIAISNKQT